MKKIKFPKQKFQIGDNVKLNLSNRYYTGNSLRSLLIKEIINHLYSTYNVNKLTKRFKELAKINIDILDNHENGVIVGVNAFGSLCSEYLPCNACYVNGSYSGLSAFSYSIVIFSYILNGENMDMVQYRIDYQLLDDDIIKNVF